MRVFHRTWAAAAIGILTEGFKDGKKGFVWLSDKPLEGDVVENAADYLPIVTMRFREVQTRAFRLCLYNAGMDPHEDCPEGALAGITYQHLRAREELVFDWCRERRLPVAFLIAGGYLRPPRMDKARLVELHRLTLTAAASSAEAYAAEDSAR